MNQSDKNQNFQWAALKAIIVEDGRVLLGKRISDDEDNGFFELPGGKCDIGETLEEAIKREVKEETGLEIELDDLSGEEGKALFVTQVRERRIMIAVVKARAANREGLVRDSEELGEIDFYTKEQIMEKLENDEIKRSERTFFEKYLKGGI